LRKKLKISLTFSCQLGSIAPIISRHFPQMNCSRTRKPLLLLAALGLLATSRNAAAAATPLYWDTSNGSGLQAGNGTWATSGATNWNTSPTPLGGGRVNWTNGDAAFFETNGTSAVTVSGTVNVDSITFDGTGYTVGDTTLTLTGTGGNITTNADATINAPLGGTVGLTKLGNSTLTLGGTSTYTGNTSVSAGTLLVNGTIGSGSGGGTQVTVGASGTLGGTGTIIGPSTTGTTAVTVNGTISAGSPSTAVGALAINNGTFAALTLNSTATFKEDIAGTGAGNFDVINVTGIVALGGTLQINELSGFHCKPGDSFLVINNDGTSDAISTHFSNAPNNGSIVTSGTDSYYVNYNGGDGNDLVLTCVPEPSTWIAAALAVLALGYTQRRKLVPALKRFSTALPPVNGYLLSVNRLNQ
jgi:autotransporter-associated beta strand protein